MPRRLISALQREWLDDELLAWRAEAILSEEQGHRIRELYETAGESAGRQQSRAVFTLMGLAGLLVGLGVLLLIGYNWESMPAGLKLVVIFGTVLGTYATGFYLRYTREAPVASEVVFFMGCLFYGAGIWLVAQIFHVNANYPDGMWWWALGVLPFALCLNTVLLHTLLVAVLGIWAGMEFFGRWSVVPNGAYSLFVMVSLGLTWAYRKNSPAAVGLYAPLLAWWVILQPFAWRLETNPIYFIGAVGGLFLLVGESHRPGSRFAIPYRLWGTLLTGGVLITLSFYEFNKDLLRRGPEPGGLVLTLATVALALATVAATVLVGGRLPGAPVPFWVRVADLIRRQWLPFVFVLLMVLLPLWQTAAGSPDAPDLAAFVPTILANVVMIACSIWLIAVGLREDRGRSFAAGVLYFLLWTVLRYVDLFGGFGGMLGAAFMFFLCGATLFSVGIYWHQRKKVNHA